MSEREPEYLFDDDSGDGFDDECMLAGSEFCDWDCGALD